MKKTERSSTTGGREDNRQRDRRRIDADYVKPRLGSQLFHGLQGKKPQMTFIKYPDPAVVEIPEQKRRC